MLQRILFIIIIIIITILLLLCYFPLPKLNFVTAVVESALTLISRCLFCFSLLCNYAVPVYSRIHAGFATGPSLLLLYVNKLN
jgi:hypothetical protein